MNVQVFSQKRILLDINKPSVVSPDGGHAKYVELGVNGLQVDSEDPDARFTALDSICESFAKCRAMGEILHAHFMKHFQAQQAGYQFLSLHLDLFRKPA